MGRNKLGLKIVRTSQGYGDGLEVNGGQQWTKNVRDVREDLKYIENLNGDSSVLMLTCIEGGNLITIASLIDGRITDCISAWIYIPSDMLIQGKTLAEVIEITRNEILAVERNNDLLRNKFDKTYEMAPVKHISQRSSSDQYAYRYYGKGCDYALWELLDDINQPYYQQYKSIFLIDKSTQLKCSVGENLSQKPLHTSILANAPRSVDGFTPYLNGNIFSSPMYVVKGETIKITWQKEGYEPITTVSTAKEGFDYDGPTPNQYKRRIPFEAVVVVDERNRAIKKYSLRINNQIVEPGGFTFVREATLNDIQIDVINADGYEAKSDRANFNQKKQFTIQLAQKIFKYKFAIPLKGDNGYLELEDYSTPNSLKKSPIEGYVPEKGDFSPDIIYMRYIPYNIGFWIKSAIILLVVLFCGIGLGAWAWDFITSNEVKNKYLQNEIVGLKSKGRHHEAQQTEIKTLEDKQSSKSDAINYLDENEKWNYTDLESYDETKDLWNALNKRRYEDILAYKSKLKDSRRFMELLEAVERNKHKSSLEDFITDSNDKNITVSRYIKKLDEAKPTQQPSSSKDKTDGGKTKKTTGKKDSGSQQDDFI